MGGRMKTSSVKLPQELDEMLVEAVNRGKAVTKSEATRIAVRSYWSPRLEIGKVPSSA